MRERRFDWPYALLVILLALPALVPILNPGYWWGAHDARHSVYFLFEFDQIIRDGVLWPRWAPDFAFGYGYPFFNIYGPLSSYLGEAFHLAGLSLVDAVKAVFGLSLLASGVAMYGFVRRLVGRRAGVVAGVAYVYLPYHLADVYVRAALAESVALIWLPLVFWGFFEVATRPRPRAVAGTAFAYTGLLLSHNGLAIQTTVVLGLFVAVLLVWQLHGHVEPTWPRRLRRLVSRGTVSAGTLLLSIGLSAIFFLPWLLEYKYVRTDQWLSGYYSYADHFVQWWQLFSPSWGFGVSVAGPGDEFAFQLGIAPLVLATAGLFVPVERRASRVRWFFVGFFLVSTIFMLPPAAPIWAALGQLLASIQFPWRLLVYAGFALAFLSGYVAARADDAGMAALALFLVVASYPYVQAEPIPPAEGPVGYAALMRFQQSADEMTGSTLWVRDIPDWSPLAEVWVNGGQVTSRVDYGAFPRGKGINVAPRWSNSQAELAEYRADASFTLEFNIDYYPGWHAYLVDPDTEEIVRELDIVPHGELGHIRVEVPAGRHAVLVRFEDTRPRRIGKLLSGISLMLCLGLILWPSKRRVPLL